MSDSKDVLSNETILKLKKVFTFSSFANALVLLAVGLMAASGNCLNALILAIVMVLIDLVLPNFVISKIRG